MPVLLRYFAPSLGTFFKSIYNILHMLFAYIFSLITLSSEQHEIKLWILEFAPDVSAR